MFGALKHDLWNERNKNIYEDTESDLQEFLQRLDKLIKHLNEYLNTNNISQNTLHEIDRQNASLKEESMHKLNEPSECILIFTNASWKANNKSCMADLQDEWKDHALVGFFFMGVSNLLTLVEAQVLLITSFIAISMG